MSPFLILAGAMAMGWQADATPDVAPVAAAAEEPTAPEPELESPERGAVMKLLRDSLAGYVFDAAGVTVSGWTQGSFTPSTDRSQQLPMGFNYRANEFLLQQNWLRVERVVDPDATVPTWGFRSDTILPGTDYVFTLPRGLFNRQLTADRGRPAMYGFDPVQFYAELNLPNVGRGLNLKLGRFFALFGVETIDAPRTALASRAYTFIYNPFTHTGLVGSMKLNDSWTAWSGIVTGSDVFVGPEANPTYIGSLKWAPPEGRDSLLLSVIACRGRYDVARKFSNPEAFDVVYARQIGERTTYTLNLFYSFQNGFPGAGASGFVNDWGVVQHLTRQMSPTLSATGRLEFFGDPQGQRTGTKGVFEAVTAGVSWKPKPWLQFRQEVRYDHDDGRPFEGHPSLFTAGLDFIVRW